MTRERLTLLVAVSTAVVVGLTVGAYAYDSSRDDLVADGVTVAGVDVGGLHRPAAKRKLAAELAGRLDRPVRVRAAGRVFRLDAAKGESGAATSTGWSTRPSTAAARADCPVASGAA